MKFRKKPVVIDAVQFLPEEGLESVLPEGVCSGIGAELVWYYGDDDDLVWYIKTPEWDIQVVPGDWIITEDNGKRYECNSEIFEATYEAAPGLE